VAPPAPGVWTVSLPISMASAQEAGDDHATPDEGQQAPLLSALAFHVTRPFEQIREKPARIASDLNRLGFMINSRTERNSWLLQVILYDHGWVRIPAEDDTWHLWWAAGQANPLAIRALRPWQRLNKFPKSSTLTLKAHLSATLNAAIARYGPETFGRVVPEAYVLPAQAELFEAVRRAEPTDTIWIVKPYAAYCGRGIFLLRNDEALPAAEEEGAERCVACRYVAKPHLIHGYKYDLRLYVLVTSWHPLCVYLYGNGLARFATSKYATGPGDLGNRMAHITNYTLNKRSANFQQAASAEEDGRGSKWTLDALRAHLAAEVGPQRARRVWEAVDALVAKACIAAEPAMLASYERYAPEGLRAQPRAGLFQLFGFDVMLDEDLKPWLLEVNLDPALGTDSPLDFRVKGPLLCDTLNLLGILGTTAHEGQVDNHRAGPLPSQADSALRQAHAAHSPEEYARWRAQEQLNGEARRARGGAWKRILPSEKSEQYRAFLEPDRWLNDLEYLPANAGGQATGAGL